MIGYPMKQTLFRTGILSAIACLLVVSVFGQEPALFWDRILYAPGHFGNSYEVMGEHEMREYLAACKDFGFNRYADWYDTADCTDPFSGQNHMLLGNALWQRKKENFRSAQDLGLPCDLVITPNHVFAEQCSAAPATTSDRIFGQLVCPSKPEGHAIILRNYENLFADLAASSIRLNALWPAPYDYGGCACAECDPYILTFTKLCRDIHEIALKHHPGIEMRFIGWWWSEEEHRLFADWVDQNAPGWVKSVALHIPYGELDVGDVPLPAGCERQAFVHIGYADVTQPIDIYGLFGPVAAPNRLQQTLDALKAHGCTGLMAYSEGVLDDVNKALLAGLASGLHQDATSVLTAYARRFFNADDATAAEWAAWLRAWGNPFSVDAEACASTLSRLTAPIGEHPWRLKQWELKLELLQAHHAVMAIPEWTPERFNKADDFWKVYERLERGVWGLGPTRGCIAKSRNNLPWYPDWAKHTAAGTVIK